MFNRNDGFSSGPRGAKGPFKKRGFGDSGSRPELHKATCASCGNTCEVPFKPNGRKPVYCRDCFKKEEGGFGGGDRAPRPAFGQREERAWGSRDGGERGGFGGADRGQREDRPKPFHDTRVYDSRGEDLEKRVSAMDAKLDRIIRELEAIKRGPEASAAPIVTSTKPVPAAVAMPVVKEMKETAPAAKPAVAKPAKKKAKKASAK